MEDEILLFNPEVDLDPSDAIETVEVIIDHPNPKKRRKLVMQAPSVLEIGEITRAARRDKNGNIQNESFLAMFIAKCCINPQFTEKTARQLLSRPAKRLKALNDAIGELCGIDPKNLSEEALKEAVQNL